MKEYEEDHEIGSIWSWALVVILCALILAWGFTIHAVVKDGPREWNFGTLPDAPSQSIYSTEEAPEKAVPPRQVAPLPEAKPRKPAPDEVEGRPPK
jgi:hypothetical protein